MVRIHQALFVGQVAIIHQNRIRIRLSQVLALHRSRVHTIHRQLFLRRVRQRRVV